MNAAHEVRTWQGRLGRAITGEDAYATLKFRAVCVSVQNTYLRPSVVGGSQPAVYPARRAHLPHFSLEVGDVYGT